MGGDGVGSPGEAYKSLPAAAYGDEVGGRRVESFPSGIYPAKEGVTVVVSAADSAARKRPRTSGQQPRAVEDEADQQQASPDPEQNGYAVHATADAGLAAVDLDDDSVDVDLEDFDADDADIQAALAEGDLEDVPDLEDVSDLDVPE